MIYANGRILPADQTGAVLDGLPDELAQTFAAPPLDPMWVVDACDALGRAVRAGEYDEALTRLKADGLVTDAQIGAALSLFSRESLLFKLETELGRDRFPVTVTPPGAPFAIERRLMPLGCLLHIAAGNVDALPAYSVVEGLLTGNINLLKLPQADHGLSILLLAALVTEEPRLAPYVYVFDTPSSDVKTLERLASFADGVVVWGGDAAVRAARQFAPVNARLIEWGHKLSFAYAAPSGVTDAMLEGLAHHIAETRQLLCSSCQGVFVDTDDLAVVHAFAARFLPILDRAMQAAPPPDIGTQAQITLLRYTARLEGKTGCTYAGDRCSLTVHTDSALETALAFGNLWVRPLPRARLTAVLRPHLGYLQTAGLLCADAQWAAYAEALARAGVTRIRRPETMSLPLAGETHDGAFALRSYTKLVETALP